jgi:parallel beta-helix repeat protein
MSMSTKRKVFTGILLMTVLLGGYGFGTFALASSAPVYPGCAVTASVPKHIFYIDPVNGSAHGDGSKAHPWNSLQAVVSSVNGASPLLSTVPYWQRQPNGKWGFAVNPHAPIRPGDALYLMSGNYGDISIGVYGNDIANSDFVTVMASPGQVPVLSSLTVSGYSPGVNIISQINGGEVASVLDEDIILDGLSISSQDDVSDWSQQDWLDKARWSGLSIRKAVCTSVSNSKIYNVRTGVGLLGDKTLFTGNVIDNFGDDALDYAASDLIITHNTITNSNTLGDGIHLDAMQGQIGDVQPGVKSNQYKNILIDSNLVIRQTDPDLKFPGFLQGIDAFDSDWYNVTVANNVVITNAYHGIAYYSLHGGVIINNTVLFDGSSSGSGGETWIGVFDKSHEGSSSDNVIVRNNIASAYSVDTLDSGVTMDHNVCSTIDGTCLMSLYVDGKQVWYDKPGVYGDYNIIDQNGSAEEFADFDPARFLFNVHLKEGAQAIGAGSPSLAPRVDIAGTARKPPIDAGAYVYVPAKAKLTSIQWGAD